MLLPWLSLSVLLLVGRSVALPVLFDDEDEDSVSIEAANGVELEGGEEDVDLIAYFATVNQLLKASAKDASEESGKLLSEWSEKSGMNPEEVGTYMQGDIRIPTALARNGLVAASSRWPGGIVPYEIQPGFSPHDLNMIEEAFRAYNRSTCVHFVRRGNHKDYIRITRAASGCWSSVGRIGSMQEVNLQTPGCLTKVGTAIHELMHAIGFMHEQNRYDRDNFVTIQWQNIESGRNNNFDKAPQGTTNPQGVEYDYRSVMHYSDLSFSKNNRPTIVAKSNGAQMGQRDGFSRGDIQKICNMYNCKCGRSQPVNNGKGPGNFLASLFG